MSPTLRVKNELARVTTVGEVTSHDDLEPDGITLSEEDRRLVAHWAADCAERVLALFEAKAPSDTTSTRRDRGGLGHSRSMASGQRTSALLPGRRTQPHAKPIKGNAVSQEAAL